MEVRGVSYTENKNSFSYYVRQTIKSCSHTQQEKDKERGKTGATQQVANCIHIVCVLFVDVVNGKRIPETGG